MNERGVAPRVVLWALIAAIVILSACASRPGADSDIPRWPPTGLEADEFFGRLAACLVDAGYAVTIHNAPVWRVEHHGIDTPEYDNAFFGCADRIDPTFFEPPPPFSEPQLRSLHDYAAAQAACLAEMGYPAIEVPSFDLFVEAGGRFDAATELRNLGAAFSFDDVLECREVSRPAWFDG